MRSWSALGGPLLAIVMAVALACGGGGDDDGVDVPDGGGGGGGEADAAVASAGLGVSCGPDVECAADTPRCLTRTGATEGFCSKECATAPVPPGGEEPPLPPKENQAKCRDGYSGPGTPFCAAPLEEEGSITWLCILACGDTPMFDFGECPGNLICVQDDPTVNGYCFPPI
jgi:hypothetical protein